jgi:cell wall-associated NlpC family hydrolase
LPEKPSVISREAAVAVAASFLKTPYILGGRVKGAGVDCGTLLALYLQECGFCKKGDFDDVGIYHHDWFQHDRTERYLLRLMRHAPKILDTICRGTVDAKPGTLALFRVVGSKIFNHGGIITHWPFMINAIQPCVKEINCVNHWLTGQREMVLFDPWSNE